jgi:hypothetical protein
MSIHKLGSDLIRPRGAAPTSADGPSPSRKKGADAAATHRADRVELSQEGLELAARLAEAAPGLGDTRRATIRERIDRGFYGEPFVAEAIASRILQAGDLIDLP